MAVLNVKKKKMMIRRHGQDHRFLLFFFVILSFVDHCFCQSDFPRNIETFYPFPISPPPADPPAPGFLPNLPPPPSHDPPSPPSSSSKKAIVTAVAATAASAFVLAAFFFLLFTRLSQKRRRNGTAVGDEGRDGGPGAVAPDGSMPAFKRFDNVKGFVVDEDGLDVLYWKKLKSNSGCFRDEPFNTANNDGDGKAATVPRGRSSSSYGQIHPDEVHDGRRSSFSFPTTVDSGGGGGQSQPRPAHPPFQRPAVATMAVATVPAPPPPAMQEKKAAPIPPPPVPKKNTPMPPPPPASKPAVPPPKPPPGGSKTPESGAGAEASGSGNDHVKLKPLHWEKVNINRDHSNVWDKIERGSFQYNGDMMEALFGVAATKRKPFHEQNLTSNDDASSNTNARIFILDPRKSQNVAIVIKSLGIPRDELIEALLEGRGLSADTLEKLTRTAPTKEEASEILAFSGDPSKLAYAEFFLYNLLTAIPSAFTRANEMLFKFNYDSEILNLKESLKTLESACNELRNRGIFLKLLEAILKAGNRLNAGTSRGNAKAFNLTTLRKLSDYKSSDGKTTLLHFVIHEVVRNEGRRCVLTRSSSRQSAGSSQQDDPIAKEEREKEYLKLGLPVVGGLSSEFSHVKKAADIDYDVLKGTIGSLANRVRDSGKLMANSGSVMDEDGGFLKEMKDFLGSAQIEIKEVEEEHIRVIDLVKETTQYYQARVSNDRNPLQLFVIVKDFLGMVDQACVEIARVLQQKKQPKPDSSSGSGSGSSNSGALRSRVTFPRLPRNFMSENSGSSSDDDS